MKKHEPRSPLKEFLDSESAGGVLLIIMTVLALIIANSPLVSYYNTILNTKLTLGVSSLVIDKPLILWINDGLMAIFFLLIGLEIKRELVAGELSSVKKALLPVTAAIGGAVVPAAIYLGINAGTDYEPGWGIVMATDIAFAVGVMALVGKNVPTWAKIFLLALAVVDDMIAVLVIAIFYTASINMTALLVAAISAIVLAVMAYFRVYKLALYLFVGFILWFAFLKSGVHATIAGVILGFLIPLKRNMTQDETIEQTSTGLNLLKKAKEEESKKEKKETNESALNYLSEVVEKGESPLHRLEHTLHPWVAFFIMPVFAFANAGISLDPDSLIEAFSSPLTIAIILGLFIGKQIGVFGLSYILTIFNISGLENTPKTRKILHAVSLLAGIGFTMSLFISGLAFTDAAILERSKVGILAVSLVSGILGYFMLKSAVKE